MVKNQHMEELSVLELTNKYNFIVPEIQREYVWGKNENQILDSFFNDITEKYQNLEALTKVSYRELKNTINPTLNEDFTKDTLAIIENELEKFQSNRSMNIGFLYSYKPNYYIYNDTSEDVYLIDGQQRFTTLFISLFYFAVLESRLDDFKSIFRINLTIEKIAFDYRVRTITHNFLIDLIANTKTKDDLKDILNKTWFLSEYGNDTSILALLGTFTKLNKKYPNEEKGYFDFLLNHIKFWHFKTEETSQGEELYITMNSRGKSLSENEILRAKLFEKLSKQEVKKKGQDWEDWQDFFWNKKGPNENSDNGFNEFLRWVQILNMVSRGKIDIDNEDEESKDKKAIIDVIKWEKKDLKLDSNYLSIKEIENTFTAVVYLFNKFSYISIGNTYSNYLNKELLDLNWLCPLTGSAIGQKECFRILPVIQYIKLLNEEGKSINDHQLYRVIRYFYNLNEIESVNKSPNVACINAIKLITDLAKISTDIADVSKLAHVSKTLLTEEEKYKFWLYKSSNNRVLIEQEFWETEDHKLNSGRIGHLIQASFETFETIDEFNYENNFGEIRKLEFNLSNFIVIKNNYFNLNPDKGAKTVSGTLWGYLIPTTYYTVSNYGTNKVITCQRSDYQALISKEYLRMVLEIEPGGTRSDYLLAKAKNIFSNYSESQNLKDEVDLKIQLFCYFILLNEIESWYWHKGKNFGCYDKSIDTDFQCLFSNKTLFQHFDQKWGGADWRNVDCNPLLDGKDYFSKLVDSSY
jgi:uncharacterized protein with ParB-like and HNH nuclease domain